MTTWRTTAKRAPAPRPALERGEVPASGLAPGAGEGAGMNLDRTPEVDR
jgi:hypothetical protein